MVNFKTLAIFALSMYTMTLAVPVPTHTQQGEGIANPKALAAVEKMRDRLDAMITKGHDTVASSEAASPINTKGQGAAASSKSVDTLGKRCHDGCSDGHYSDSSYGGDTLTFTTKEKDKLTLEVETEDTLKLEV